MMDPALALMLRFALAGLFVWAAVHKLRDLAGFRVTLNEYGLVPEFLLAPIAALLVGAEALIALGYVIPVWDQAAAAAGTGLFMLYAAAIGINLLRGRSYIDCGCFGPSRNEPISPALVARNLLLAVVSAACLWPVADRPLVWLDAFTIGGGVLFCGAIYVSVNNLVPLMSARVPFRGVAHQGE